MAENELAAQNNGFLAQYQSSSVQGLLDSVQRNEKITALVQAEFPPDRGEKTIEEFVGNGQNYRFCKVNKLSFDKDFPKREAFENVIECMGESPCNFVYVLSGDESGVSLHLGVVRNDERTPSSVMSTAARAIKNAVEGNFNGSEIVGSKNPKYNRKDPKGESEYVEFLSKSDFNELLFGKPDKDGRLPKYYTAAGVITGIPSVNKSEKGDDADFQGIDRVINSMLGKKWRIIIVCNRATQEEIMDYRNRIYNIFNAVSPKQKYSLQISKSTGSSDTKGEGTSETSSKTKGTNESFSKTHETGHSDESSGSSSSTSKSTTKGTSDSITESGSKSKNSSHTKQENDSTSANFEIVDKSAQEISKYIDEELLERIRLGASKGLFKTSVYYMADTAPNADALKYGITSLFQGNKSSFSPLVAHDFDFSKSSQSDSESTDKNEENDGKSKSILAAVLSTFQNQRIKIENENADRLSLLGHPLSTFRDEKSGMESLAAELSTYLTGREISLLAGLPQKEVPGIVLKESTVFALNAKPVDEKNEIALGHIMQKGRELAIPFIIDKKSLSKHTFIAGTTGSGKTTTCHRLLKEADCPFLVIEPAKTEYRVLLNDSLKEVFGDVTVFTLGNETCAPFRLNPFELIEGENITSHIDMVKAAFVSAFPMEASMPQLLEEAIYKCYEDKGWNVDTNQNKKYKRPFDAGVNSFPILSDLLKNMKTVVEDKHFSDDMKNDYIGSLVSRLSNLTVGSKGALLNCPHSINFEYIATHKVILELEELKSPEDKSLVMGFILSKLSAVVKKLHGKYQKENKDEYKHLTLVEEAHRLLSKVEYGDSGSKKSAVETFTDLLAEVRKYGEGLIVVDQIPNKLASEVLKNTNTKIIHKIFAKDDKDAVGDTMLMDDKQKQYLSALEPGEVIIFTENTEAPVHVKVEAITNTSGLDVGDDFVREKFLALKNSGENPFGGCYANLEIRSFYKEFLELAKKLVKGEIDEKSCEEVKSGVDSAMETYGISDRKDIWQKVVDYFELTTGNSSLESVGQIKETFMHFFTEDFYNNDFYTQGSIPSLVKINLGVVGV